MGQGSHFLPALRGALLGWMTSSCNVIPSRRHESLAAITVLVPGCLIPSNYTYSCSCLASCTSRLSPSPTAKAPNTPPQRQQGLCKAPLNPYTGLRLLRKGSRLKAVPRTCAVEYRTTMKSWKHISNSHFIETEGRSPVPP